MSDDIPESNEDWFRHAKLRRPKNADECTSAEIEILRRSQCPDCNGSLTDGPRGGAGQNLFCAKCGEGYNVAYPRFIMFGQRIGKRR